MYSRILIRFGELAIKGKNKVTFIRRLADNLRKNEVSGIKVEHDRMFVDYNEKNLDVLSRTFGIYSYSPVIAVETNEEKIHECIKENAGIVSNKTFRVTVRRNQKLFKTSMELAEEYAQIILKNSFNPSVKLKNFDVEFSVEIRKDFTYIFFERIKGLGGFPVGINGRVLHLISGGFDSPIAAYEMMKKGLIVDFLNFVTPPHTDQRTIDKVNWLVTYINKYQGQTRIYRSDYSDLMNLINMISDQSYKITLMRRSFYRIANKLAYRNGYQAISNGESLGQVASQTLESMSVIEKVSEIPVFRPLLTKDKQEIIDEAMRIGTYEISAIRASESCELFAPQNPVTKPKLWIAEKLESELGERLFEYEKNNLDNQLEAIIIKRDTPIKKIENNLNNDNC